MPSLETIIHYLEVGAAMATAIGIVGHALAKTPWTVTKAIGNALNAVSVDLGDLANSVKNAKDAVAAKKAEDK